MNNYIINNNTLAILPYLDKYSIIYEIDQILIYNKRPNNIINYNCLSYGKNLQGCLYGTSKLLNTKYKNPIFLNNDLILFPTTSIRLKNCSWINLFNIINITSINKSAIINFINDKNINFKISKNIIQQQVIKSYFLNTIIMKKYGDKS